MIEQQWPVLVLILGLFLPLYHVSAGTVLSSNKYAWSNNVGYINFENVTVSDSALSGYAWSANSGWIKFDPAQGGVANDGTGNLSGSAWGANLGWIDFNGVSIHGSTGEFSGTATGELVGTITFDCDYCDVRTDWRQVAIPPVVTSGGGGGGGSSTSIPPQIHANNVPLIILPEQSGTLAQDTPAGKITLEVPANTVANKTTFTITEELLNQTNDHLVVGGKKLLNAVFFNVSAKDQNGNELRSFSNPITITLPIPTDFIGVKNLAVYWLNETNWQWVLIPDAVFTNGKAAFQVTHLTKFAIFVEATNGASRVPTVVPPSLPLPLDQKPVREKGVTNQQALEKERPSTDGIMEPSQSVESVNGVANRPDLEKNGTKSDSTEELSRPIENVNRKQVAAFIMLCSIVLFVFLKKR